MMRGFERHGFIIAIEDLPDRKRPVLAIREGNCETVIATFQSTERANFFYEKFKWFLENPESWPPPKY